MRLFPERHCKASHRPASGMHCTVHVHLHTGHNTHVLHFHDPFHSGRNHYHPWLLSLPHPEDPRIPQRQDIIPGSHFFGSSHVRIPMENSLHPAGPNHHNRLEIYNRSPNSGSNPLPHTDKNRPKNIPTALPSKSIKNQLKPYQYYRAVPPSIVALRSRREAAYSINFQPHFSINCYNARKTKIQSGGQP